MTSHKTTSPTEKLSTPVDLSVIINVCPSAAWDVFHLRNSSMWTPSLEQELIKLHYEGTPPPDLSKFARGL
jgi:hypothetical protein